MFADSLLTVLALGALAPGHHAGDYWLQSDHQALHKGDPGRAGRAACARHVASLTAAQAALLALALMVTGTPAALLSVAAGLAVNAVWHGWIDRRWTLRGLMLATERWTSKRGFFDHGGAAPMDQAAHRVVLLPAALAIAAPPLTAGIILAASLAVLGVCHVVARRAVLRDARRQAAATAS
jgi:hypothetical protein